MLKKTKTNKAIEFIEEYWNPRICDPSSLNFFSDNLIYKTTLGNRVGKESYHTHREDWKRAFPDLNVAIITTTEVKNTVVIEGNCQRTHLNPYKDTDKNDNIISKTNFLDEFQKHPPSKVASRQHLEIVFIFGASAVDYMVINVGDEALYRKQLRMGQSDYQMSQTNLYEIINAKITYPLAKRELECLSLGFFYRYSAKDIARILGISYRTVETHRYNAYQKLGCCHMRQCFDLINSLSLLPLFKELSESILTGCAKNLL